MFPGPSVVRCSDVTYDCEPFGKWVQFLTWCCMVLWPVSVTIVDDDPPDLLPFLSATLFTFLRRDRYDRYVSCARSRRRQRGYAVPCREKLLTRAAGLMAELVGDVIGRASPISRNPSVSIPYEAVFGIQITEARIRRLHLPSTFILR